MAPWMNPFRLGPDTIVGYFKHHGLEHTVFTPQSPPTELSAAKAAYEDYMAGQPFWLVDVLLEQLGSPTELSFLELGCGTGRFAFELALRGAGDVTGVDIREHNIVQAQFLQDLDERLSQVKTLRFAHEPASADDPDYLTGESFDVVWMTVFPILRRPVDQLMNVARLARRAALFHIKLAAPPVTHWELMHRWPDQIVNSADGYSWLAPAASFAELLTASGFTEVIEFVHPLVQPLRDQVPKEPSRLVRLLLPGDGCCRTDIDWQHHEFTLMRARLCRLYADPSYFTFLALK